MLSERAFRLETLRWQDLQRALKDAGLSDVALSVSLQVEVMDLTLEEAVGLVASLPTMPVEETELPLVAAETRTLRRTSAIHPSLLTGESAADVALSYSLAPRNLDIPCDAPSRVPPPDASAKLCPSADAIFSCNDSSNLFILANDSAHASGSDCVQMPASLREPAAPCGSASSSSSAYVIAPDIADASSNVSMPAPQREPAAPCAGTNANASADAGGSVSSRQACRLCPSRHGFNADKCAYCTSHCRNPYCAVRLHRKANSQA